MDAAERPPERGTGRHIIRKVIQRHHEDFERLVLRISDGNAVTFEALMSGTMKSFVRTCEFYLENVVASQERTRKAKGSK